MATSTRLKFGIISDFEIGYNGATITDYQSFSQNSIKSVIEHTTTSNKNATLQSNYTLLDGTFSMMSATEKSKSYNNLGWYSNSMSASDGIFKTTSSSTGVVTLSPIVLILDRLGTPQYNTAGMTIKFGNNADEYCNSFNVSFYYDSTLILSKNCTPTSNLFVFEQAITGFNKIIFTFNSTNKGNRFLNVSDILIGVEKVYSGENVTECKVYESIDLLSNTLSINTLDFSIYDDNGDFNILNPKGIYAGLMENQKIVAQEIVNDNIVEMGTFYLKEWFSKNNIASFKCEDIMSLTERIDYGGVRATNAGSWIEDILYGLYYTGTTPIAYTITTELSNATVNGYLPISTSRENLQKLLFVINGIADCSRSNTINLYRLTPKTPKHLKDIFDGIAFEKLKNVDALNITAYSYTVDTSASNKVLFSEAVTEPTPIITFDSPVFPMSISISADGSIMNSATSDNHVAIEVVAYPGEPNQVTITGNPYIINTFDKSYNFTSSSKPYKISIDKNEMISPSELSNVYDIVRTFYQTYQYKIKFRKVLTDERLGDTIIVDGPYNTKFKGVITELNIDLAGGFIAEFTALGYKYEEAIVINDSGI